MSAEHLQFLGRIAALCDAGNAVLNRRNRDRIERDSWKAMGCFLLGYAYARQGVSPVYGPAAWRAIQKLAGASWNDAELAQRAWELYEAELNDQSQTAEAVKLNEKNNPMCPRGTYYQGSHRKTNYPSAIEFAQEHLSDFDYNILGWAKVQLGAEEVKTSHRFLTSINGIGQKIASLFLRDVALAYDIELDQSRELLQPVDVWVRRYVRYWEQDNGLSDNECARWIVERSLAAEVSPEKVNAGMWYFGSLIAGDERSLLWLIDDADAMRQEVEKHVDRLEAQVTAWRSTREDV
jgi:hypothetical protein